MSIDIRLPNINGKTDSEQLSQIRSYLYQFASQLQWALNTVESSGTEKNNSSVVFESSKELTESEALSTFNSIKSLIIKSADIVEAYSEAIDNLLDLDGTYAAEANFPNGSLQYIQDTNATVSANSTNIETAFKNIQTITGTIEGIEKSMIDTEAYVRTGLLDDTVTPPVYGVEVGQTDTLKDPDTGEETKIFNRFARFSSDKLAFYDAAYPDAPVAYISGFRLVITEAYVKGNLQVGGFILDTSDGIALRWVGRYS